jgi:hypothetical protein
MRMSLLVTTSLAATLNHLHIAHLEGRTLTAGERNETAAWIAARVGQSGSYSGLPAPTARDYGAPVQLFSGEVVRSGAGTGCRLGFEAAWALAFLKPSDWPSKQAATTCQALASRMFAKNNPRNPRGMYCCYHCTPAGWQALGASSDGAAEGLLGSGLSLLRSLRNDKGRWARFPFWYTLLGLSGLEHKAAANELRYAAGALDRFCAKPARDAVAKRRRLLATYVLERAQSAK